MVSVADRPLAEDLVAEAFTKASSTVTTRLHPAIDALRRDISVRDDQELTP